MIQSRLTYDAQWFTNAKRYTKRFSTTVEGYVDIAYNEIKQPLLDDLRAPVPNVKYPIQWTSEKQRRAYFATDGFGHGIPYKRTGKLLARWEIKRTAKGITVSNPSRIAKYVIGTLNAKTFDSQIQRFHRNTGWKPAKPKVSQHLERARSSVIEQFHDGLSGFGKLTI